jgi:hypothetical protein
MWSFLLTEDASEDSRLKLKSIGLHNYVLIKTRYTWWCSSIYSNINDALVIKTFLEVGLFKCPITVAARSEAWTVFARSNAGIVVSNHTQGVDVRVYSMFVLFCV